MRITSRDEEFSMVKLHLFHPASKEKTEGGEVRHQLFLNRIVITDINKPIIKEVELK